MTDIRVEMITQDREKMASSSEAVLAEAWITLDQTVRLGPFKFFRSKKQSRNGSGLFGDDVPAVYALPPSVKISGEWENAITFTDETTRKKVQAALVVAYREMARAKANTWTPSSTSTSKQEEAEIAF